MGEGLGKDRIPLATTTSPHRPPRNWVMIREPVHVLMFAISPMTPATQVIPPATRPRVSIATWGCMSGLLTGVSIQMLAKAETCLPYPTWDSVDGPSGTGYSSAHHTPGMANAGISAIIDAIANGTFQ